jgi:two-component system, OmpR family, phosphate regulon sensor histidine kinase PhoR
VRKAEIRLFTILMLAVAVITGASYWMAVQKEGLTTIGLARGALLVVGGILCIGLGFYALRRDWIRERLQIFKDIEAALLAGAGDSAPIIADSMLTPLVTNVRDEMDKKQQRIDELQMQRKNLEIKLRIADAERRQSYTMIHGISDAVLVTNEFDELVTANPAAEELFGFLTKDSVRKPLMDLVAVGKIRTEITDMRQSHGRTNRRSFEHTIEREGRKCNFTVTMTCVTDGNGAFNSLVTVLHDTTRENEVSRMKSEFVSHVSHELRTPLSSIKAYAEMLVDGEAGDEKTAREFYQVIQGEADRLSRLIDNILNISRIESGMTRVNKKSANLSAILKDVLEVAMPSARDKKITLTDEVPPVFFNVDVDRDMIYQAALNLVSNAIKYTPEGGKVRVILTVEQDQSAVTLNVTDNGVGIPADAMKHLFEKFFRVEQNKSMAKGSGLGLNLTRQIIEAVHRGKMHVSSEVGKGSTFGFTLPVAV